MKSLLLVLLLASVTLTGCVIFQEEVNVTENETPPPPPPPPPPTPSFSITSPASGEVVMVSDESSGVDLVLRAQNLLLRAPGGVKKIGEGYFLITVDGGQSETSSSKTFTMTALGEGEHTVEVELVHNDGTSYSPRIADSVTFTVQEEEPEEYVPQSYEVKMMDFTYDPAAITVKVSDTVVFKNEGSFPRSATCFLGGKQVFDTGVIGPGKSASVTMDSEFECEYYSTTHMAMKGNIKVESNES